MIVWLMIENTDMVLTTQSSNKSYANKVQQIAVENVALGWINICEGGFQNHIFCQFVFQMDYVLDLNYFALTL